MKKALLALGMSVSMAMVSSVALATTEEVKEVKAEPRHLKIEMQHFKKAVDVLRTTTNHEEAWNAVLDIRDSAMWAMEYDHKDAEGKKAPTEGYTALYKKIVDLTVTMENEVNKHNYVALPALLDQLDKIKVEGHKAYKH